MKQFILLLSLLCVNCSLGNLSAQTPETDSLEMLLKLHRKADTARVSLLNTTALKFYQIDNEKLLGYAGEAIELSSKLKYEAGRAEGLRLIGLYHYNKADNQQAREYFQESLILNEAIGNKKGISSALIYLGLVSWRLGDIDKFMEYNLEAFAIAEQLGDKVLLSACHKSFGILYLVQGDYPQAIEYFQKAIVLSEEIGDGRVLSDCLNNIGYIHMRQGNNAKALDYFQRTNEVLQQIGDKQSISSSYINIGIVHQNQGNYPKAIDNYEKARVLFEEFGDIDGIARCLNNIGLIYQNQGNYPQALENIQSSLKIYEETGDKRGISSSLMNIGGIYETQGNPAKALEYFQRSITLFEELGDKQGISNCIIRIGNAYILQGNYREALEYFQNALVIKEELGDKYGIASCLKSLGNIHEMQGDHAMALSYYQNSMGIREEIEDKSGICLLLADIGKVYLKTNNYSKALDYCNKGLKIASELKLLQAQERIYEQLSEIYYATKNYRKAYQNHVLYRALYDSIFNEKEIAKFTGLEYQYMYEKEKQALELDQQKKDAIQAEEAKRQKVFRNSLIIGFSLTALLLFVILLSFLEKRRANRILEEQKREIESQSNKITDSIHYAQRIQKALFPPKEVVDELLPDYFIFNKPRDIVSGDYYWLAEKEDNVILAVADCTGHGVPGAFMSVLGIAFLNEIVSKTEALRANDILFHLREQVIRSLHQKGKKDEQRDGMDISLCIFNFKRKTMQFAGAFNQLYLIRKQELIELKGDKMPIGISVRKDQAFTNKEMQLKRNDSIYLCTDGFVDQIGGPRRKTFRSKYFKDLLLKIHERKPVAQLKTLEKTFEDWRGEIEQIDDILIIGIKV